MAFDLDADIVELAPYASAPAAALPLPEMAFRANAWSQGELDSLRGLFTADASIDAISARIGRPFHAIRSKICDLGLRRNSARPWSDMEEAEIVRRYGDDPTADIARDLGRSCVSVYQRAYILGVAECQEPDYTAWEDAQLRAGFAAGIPVVQIAALIGRTLSSVTSRAGKVLHLRHANAPVSYSKEECARALELVQEGDRYAAIRAQLEAEGYPPRTPSSFKQMMRMVGFGRGWGRLWLADEDELLRRAYSEGSNLPRLADRLGRTRNSLKWRAEYLGLQGTHPSPNGNRKGPIWTDEEIATLQARYGKAKSKEIAADLGRPLMAVLNKAWQLGLKHGMHRPFTPAEDRAIEIAGRHGLNCSEVARALGRDPTPVREHALRLGVTYAKGKGGFGKKSRTFTLAEILALEGKPVKINLSPRRVRKLAKAYGMRPRKLSRKVAAVRLTPRHVRRIAS